MAHGDAFSKLYPAFLNAQNRHACLQRELPLEATHQAWNAHPPKSLNVSWVVLGGHAAADSVSLRRFPVQSPDVWVAPVFWPGPVRLGGGLLVAGQQSLNEGMRLARLGGGRQNRLLVALQNLDPIRQVIGMVG